jgi:hypothetical protein
VQTRRVLRVERSDECVRISTRQRAGRRLARPRPGRTVGDGSGAGLGRHRARFTVQSRGDHGGGSCLLDRSGALSHLAVSSVPRSPSRPVQWAKDRTAAVGLHQGIHVSGNARLVVRRFGDACACWSRRPRTGGDAGPVVRLLPVCAGRWDHRQPGVPPPPGPLPVPADRCGAKGISRGVNRRRRSSRVVHVRSLRWTSRSLGGSDTGPKGPSRCTPPPDPRNR